MQDFNALVEDLAKKKRRMDRVGALLMASEAAYANAARSLELAIARECRARGENHDAAVHLAWERRAEAHVAETPVEKPEPQSAPIVDDHRSIRCGRCKGEGHNKRNKLLCQVNAETGLLP